MVMITNRPDRHRETKRTKPELHMTDTDTTRERGVVAGAATRRRRRSEARERRRSAGRAGLAGLPPRSALDVAAERLRLRERANRLGDDGGRPRRADSGGEP